MMIRVYGALMVLLLISGAAVSQGEKGCILLMTGKELKGRVTDRDSMFLYYEEVRKPGKLREGKLDLERVFSYQDSVGNETVIYVMDTLVGNYFSPDEMRYYIYGEQQAFKSYRANWVVYSALPLSGGVGYLLSSSFFVFSVPFLYVVGTSIPGVAINAKKLEHPEMLKEPAFVLGYERTARTRRLFKALVAGLVGTAVGFTIGQVTAQ